MINFSYNIDKSHENPTPFKFFIVLWKLHMYIMDGTFAIRRYLLSIGSCYIQIHLQASIGSRQVILH